MCVSVKGCVLAHPIKLLEHPVPACVGGDHLSIFDLLNIVSPQMVLPPPKIETINPTMLRQNVS